MSYFLEKDVDADGRERRDEHRGGDEADPPLLRSTRPGGKHRSRIPIW